MIATLAGTLLKKNQASLILDIGGVGYEVFFPENRHHELPPEGDRLFLHIQTVVREDAISLYGFLDMAEKEMFRLLMGVSGIGPKLASNILAVAPAADLCRAIGGEEVARLTRLPGIGKKTAERICLELKEKVAALSFVHPLPDREPAVEVNGDDERVADVVSALVNLGYPHNQARRALDKVRQDLDEETFASLPVPELLRHALRTLA